MMPSSYLAFFSFSTANAVHNFLFPPVFVELIQNSDVPPFSPTTLWFPPLCPILFNSTDEAFHRFRVFRSLSAHPFSRLLSVKSVYHFPFWPVGNLCSIAFPIRHVKLCSAFPPRIKTPSLPAFSEETASPDHLVHGENWHPRPPCKVVNY